MSYAEYASFAEEEAAKAKTERYIELQAKIAALVSKKIPYENARNSVEAALEQCSSEKERWDTISSNFQTKVSEIVKDKMFTGELANQFKEHASQLSEKVADGAEKAGHLESALSDQIVKIDDKIAEIEREIWSLRMQM